MTAAVAITRASYVDTTQLLGTATNTVRWPDLGIDPGHDKLRWKQLFASKFEGFRRLDRLSKLICIADEAAGIGERSAALGAETALYFGSVYGCLAADLAFEASLTRPAGLEAGLFPYTLPSTALCEVAIRHGLQGPTSAIAVEPDDEAHVLRLAGELIAAGEARACVVCLGDWLPRAAAEQVGVASRTRLGLILLETEEPDREPPVKVNALLEARDPLATLASALSKRSS